jgi:hypothetical protein
MKAGRTNAGVICWFLESTCSDPVEGCHCAECSVDIAGQGKHGLVQGREQGAEDDHLGRGQYVGQGPTHTLGSIAEELGNRLEVPYLEPHSRLANHSMPHGHVLSSQ